MPTGDYRLADGTPVPGVTTVIGQLHKPALIYWAHKMGREGKSLDDERDRATGGGTYAHALIESALTGSPVEEVPECEAQRIAGETAMARWEQWRQAVNPAVMVDIERQLVSERLRVGGCPDLVYRDADGLVWVADWKTQHSVKAKPYESHVIQLAAYSMLYEEVTGTHVDGVRVVLLASNPRARNGWRDFPIPTSELDDERQAFESLRTLYDHMGRIKGRLAA